MLAPKLNCLGAMMTDSALEPAVLFKNDSARPIDRVIDYFGEGAIRQEDVANDAQALEAPSPR